ncbi:hypothetical protein GCM10009745_59510 [Kribbella yunnanensis]|uniref:DUF2690 domain-containing protein n=1 Tax=Kribbella yunnanensis TaxID=190194 RepID=A0ABN2IFK4_9ACTN
MKRTTRWGVIAALLVSMQTAAVPAGAALPTCYAASCTGYRPTDAQGPNGVRCSDDARSVTADNHLVYSPPFTGAYLSAQTVSGYWNSIMVELRYSPACRATWSRVYSRGDANFHGKLSTWIVNQPSQETNIHYDGSGDWFTRMVDGSKVNCFGMQIYHQDIWRAWKQAFCV